MKIVHPLLLLSILHLLSASTNDTLHSLQLNQSFLFNSTADDSVQQHYQLSLPITNHQILLITALTQDHSYLQIFVDFGQELEPIFPTRIQNQQSCYGLVLNTCPINITNQQVAYLTITSDARVDYSLLATLSAMEQISQFQPINLNFTQSQASIFYFNTSNFPYDQVNILVSYDEKDTEKSKIVPFNVRAGENKLPTSAITQLQGFNFNLGAFSQVLKFMNNTDSQNVYYIVVSAFEGTILDLYIYVPVNILHNDYLYSGVIWSYLQQYQVSQYHYNQSFPQTITEDILIEMGTLGGQGSITLYYCGQSVYKFINVDGQYGRFVISIPNRQACKQIQQFEQIVVQVDTPLLYLGYQFQFVMNEPLKFHILDTYQEQGGLFNKEIGNQSCIMYDIQQPSSTQLQLMYECEGCQVSLLECDGSKCSQLPLDGAYTWTTNDNSYKVNVCPSTPTNHTFNTYSIRAKKVKGNLRQLDLNAQQYQIVSMNQIQQFHIEVDEQKSSSTLQIKVRTINGQLNMFTSLEDHNPDSKDHDYWWGQSASYSIKDITDGVYVGIQGRTQSIYTIQVHVQQHQSIIELSDGHNPLSLQQNQTDILTYNAHIHPYYLYVNPMPSCLQFFTDRGDITEERKCLKELPSAPYTDETFYLRIHNNETININITILIPQLILQQFSNVAVGCFYECYTDITVQVPFDMDTMDIRHVGLGSLSLNDKQYTNETLTIDCEDVGCRKKIKAYLPYGGMMFVENANLQSHLTTWMKQTTPMDIYNGLNILYQLYPGENKLILHSEHSSLNVHYTGYRMNVSQTNTLNYRYNPPLQAPLQFKSQPFTTFSVLNLSEEIQCESMQYCFVSMSIYVDLSLYPIASTPLLSFSSNSYTYSLSTTMTIRSVFGLSAFNVGAGSFITLQPLSNCDPKINQIQSQYGQVQTQQFSVNVMNDCVFSVSATSCPYKSILPGISYELYVTSEPINMQIINEKKQTFIIYASKEASISVSELDENCALPTTYTYNRPSGSSTLLEVNGEASSYIMTIQIDSDEPLIIFVMASIKDKYLHLVPESPIFTNIPAKLNYNTKQQFIVCFEKQDEQSDDSEDIDVRVYTQQQLITNSTITISKGFIQCVQGNTMNSDLMMEYTIEVTGKPMAVEIAAAQQSQATKLQPSIAHRGYISNLERQCFTSDTIEQKLKYTIIFGYPLSKDQFSIFTYDQVSFEADMLNDYAVELKMPNSDQNTWCLISLTPKTMDYYITLNGNNIYDLVEEENAMMLDVKPNDYTLFQYINPQNPMNVEGLSPFLVKMVNCLGTNTNLYGNDNYEEIVNGRTTTISNSWNDQITTIGTVQISVGYYYLGVLSSNDTLYSLEVMYASDLSIIAQQCSLYNKTISTQNSNDQHLVVAVSPLVINQKDIVPIYTLLIANSQQYLGFQLSAVVRCPSLDPQAAKNLKRFELTNPDSPMFEVPNDLLTPKVQLFVYVSVRMPNANTNVSFYYEPTTFEVIVPQNKERSEPSLILQFIGLLLFTAGIWVILRIGFECWERRNKPKIQFEMTENTSRVKTNSQGYGQFIDEAQ